jgi:hypothetical protein
VSFNDVYFGDRSPFQRNIWLPFSALLLACMGYKLGLITETEDGKRRAFSQLYSATAYKRALFIHTSVRTSYLTLPTLLLPSYVALSYDPGH